MATDAVSWHDANQKYLWSALSALRVGLRRRLESVAGHPAPAETTGPSSDEVRQAMASPPALDELCAIFDLTPFERDIVLLCAGVQLDPYFRTVCAALHGEPTMTAPTFGLAVASLPAAHWSALTPDAPLRRWGLVEVGDDAGLPGGPLRIDERVLHYLLGVPTIDRRLMGLLEPVAGAAELPQSQSQIAERIRGVWTDRPAPWPIVQVYGSDRQAQLQVLAAVCGTIGVRLLRIRSDAIPAAPEDQDALARLWEREAALETSALLIDVVAGVSDRTAQSFIDRVQGLIAVADDQPLAVAVRPVVRFELPRLSGAEQVALWRTALGPLAMQLNGRVEAIVAQFDLDAPAILTAAELPDRPIAAQPTDLGIRLWEACRTQARVRLDDLAQRIESAADWDDLVLPATEKQMLEEIATHVRQRSRVYDAWGFAGRGARGLGISALFAGPSGTGKTMAAEVVARTLRLDLYRVDLSAIVSKYIGETEKNLKRIFDAAELGAAILLFDEADALFGKRSDVKDSHDRYANIEVSYLLQRIETYRGLAILTTNMLSAVDQAFLRRMRFVVRFPMPDATQRTEIWRRIFPDATPTDQLDLVRLAQLNLAGGNIRNIALHAAFLAADAEEPVRMAHLLRATRGECVKIDRPLTDAEIRGWT